MLKFKILFLFILSVACYFLVFSAVVHAQEIKQVVLVNPIRGDDFWENDFDLLDVPKKQYELIQKYKLEASWLVRYDGLENPEVVNFLKSLNSSQDIGLFFEVTPALTDLAGVKYNQSLNWHYAKSVLLTGYKTQDRRAMIDTAFKKYQQIFGKNPKSVGAWWIDANSLNYMREKYGVEANLAVADQHSTDQYQVWGQYFSTPYYPSKANALNPAQSVDRKIGVVTIQWATRDPYNSYGSGVNDSTYSVQVNDYLIHELNSNYFEKLLEIYPQTTIGLENDFSWNQFGAEYQKQLEIISQRKVNRLLEVKTMSNFANFYQTANPKISPDVLISADDPLDTGYKVVWYQTTKYRVGWFFGPYGSAIRDLRLYNDSQNETCFDVPCSELNLAKTVAQTLDDVTTNTKWLIDEGKIANVLVKKIGDTVEIKYTNQAGSERLIKFLANDIEVNGQIQPISFAILNATMLAEEQIKTQKIEFPEESIYLEEGISNQFFGFGKFLLFVFIFLMLPGLVISKRLLISIPLGISLFTLVSFISGLAHLDILVWILPVVSLAVLIKNRPQLLLIPKFNIFSLAPVVLIFLGSISWLLTTVKSGMNYNFGLGFWGPNGHDGIWHLSLIQELQKNIPPNNPIYSGEKLENYHYFFDLLIAKTELLFNISSVDLLFRFYPLLISILIGLLMYCVVKRLAINEFNFSKRQGLFAGLVSTFLLYFGGSFGWVVSFFRDQSLGGESMFWAQQSISTLLNPPFAISLLLILSGFYLFLDYKNKFLKISLSQLVSNNFIKHFDWRLTFSIVLIWGTLIEFKAYAGILILASLGLLTFENVVFRKNFNLLPLMFITSLLSVAIFLPNNSGAINLFVFSPLWFITSMIDFQDRLGWYRLSLAIHSDSLFKVVVANLVGILIFFIGNFGTRIIGFLAFKELNKERFFLYILIVGIIIPMLFIQTGTNWNSLQFFYYSMFCLSIFAGIIIAKLSRNSWKTLIFSGVLIIFFTIPTTINTSLQYTPSRSPSRLSVGEKEALEFLKKQPEGIILNLPFDEKLKNKYLEPLPLAAYTSTAYVSAFSNKSSFLEDTVNLDILGIDYKGKLNLQRDFFRIKERSKVILKDNGISYVYIIKSSGFEENENRMGIKKIFENSEVKIFKSE